MYLFFSLSSSMYKLKIFCIYNKIYYLCCVPLLEHIFPSQHNNALGREKVMHGKVYKIYE